MRKPWHIFLGLCATTFILPLASPGADVDVSVGVDIHAKADFYAPLSGQGAWVTVGSYGRCFHPAGIPAEWRPYAAGQWVWTDAGWYWQSDEPWAWACYHYGSWVDDPSAGWIWVPEVEWSPAWVVWRTGGGYVGWAPCAPAGVVVAPALFGFVEIGHFNDPIRRDTLVVNNINIIKKTTVIRGASHETRELGGRSVKIAINQGPKVADIEKATGKKLAPAPIAQAARRTPAPAALSKRATPETAKPETPVRPTEPSRVEPARTESPAKAEPPKERRQPDRENVPLPRPVEPSKAARPVEPGRGPEEKKPEQKKPELVLAARAPW